MNFRARRHARPLLFAVVLMAVCGLEAVSCGAVSTPRGATSHHVAERLNSSTTPAGLAYAQSLLATAPLPSAAGRVGTLPSPMADGYGVPSMKGLIDVHRSFVLKEPVNLDGFLFTHHPNDSVITGPNTSSGTNLVSTTSYALTLPFGNRHISFEQIDYTSGRSFGGINQLRVDVLLQWSPIHTVLMPTSGVVTVTLFRKISLSSASSDPISVVLHHSQALKVRSTIAALSNTLGGLCMEDSVLFKVTVSAGRGKGPSWDGVASECPDVLAVTTGSARYLLSDGSCTLETLIATFFSKEANNETVRTLRRCVPFQE